MTQLELPQNNSAHTQYYLKKTKKAEDEKIQQAYYDCVQLQLQINLAQRAIDRLQKAVGLSLEECPTTHTTATLLKQASLDKLRVLGELLLDSLLSMTYSTPTIPQLPVSLYTVFTPAMCESLFKNLCVNGTRKMQLYAGILLVRLCGNQGWWGDFLGNMLHEFFTHEQPMVFPQDRWVIYYDFMLVVILVNLL